MPDIKIDSKLRKAAITALEPYSDQIFTNQSGEWVAVVTLAHAARTEEIKTEDDCDYLATAVKMRVVDAEIVTGPHADRANQVREEARRERTTAGTLIDEAFDNN